MHVLIYVPEQGRTNPKNSAEVDLKAQVYTKKTRNVDTPTIFSWTYETPCVSMTLTLSCTVFTLIDTQALFKKYFPKKKEIT